MKQSASLKHLAWACDEARTERTVPSSTASTMRALLLSHNLIFAISSSFLTLVDMDSLVQRGRGPGDVGGDLDFERVPTHRGDRGPRSRLGVSTSPIVRAC